MAGIRKFLRTISIQSIKNQAPNLSGNQLIKNADNFYSTKNYEEAMKLYTKLLNIYLQQSDNLKNNQIIARAYQQIGRCRIKLQDYDKALKNLNRALQIYQNTTLIAEKDRSIAATIYDVAHCHLDLQNYDEALKNLADRFKFTKTQRSMQKKI